MGTGPQLPLGTDAELFWIASELATLQLPHSALNRSATSAPIGKIISYPVFFFLFSSWH